MLDCQTNSELDRPRAAAPTPDSLIGTAEAAHRIEIELLPHSPTAAHLRYRVTHLGQVLIASTRDPEYDACRALLALGIAGTMTTFNRGSPTPCMRIDIERGAQMRTNEGTKAGPRLAKWRPFDRFDDDADPEPAE